MLYSTVVEINLFSVNADHFQCTSVFLGIVTFNYLSHQLFTFRTCLGDHQSCDLAPPTECKDVVASKWFIISTCKQQLYHEFNYFTNV